MTGKDPVCVVTGASAGIGRETARGLAERGYVVVIIGRDQTRTEEAVVYVRSHSSVGLVESRLCDFSSLEEVRKDVYKRQPNPFPKVFGYHEVFHLLVLIACGALFEVVRQCLLHPV